VSIHNREALFVVEALDKFYRRHRVDFEVFLCSVIYELRKHFWWGCQYWQLLKTANL